MTPDEAKEKVWEHWELLNGLSNRRFPGKVEEAQEAVNFALDKLQEDDWRRVRAWKGKSTFPAFLAVLVKRLFVDFTRKKYGHRREPKWLQEKHDPIWHYAYELLVEHNHSRREAVEILACRGSRARWFLEEVVNTVKARCPPIEKPIMVSNSDAALGEIPNGTNPEPPNRMIDDEIDDIAEILCGYIDSGNESHLPSEIRQKVEQVSRHLHLNDEDRLIVRLYLLEGVNLQKVKTLLHLNGDIYKRYKKIIKYIREGCERAGLLEL